MQSSLPFSKRGNFTLTRLTPIDAKNGSDSFRQFCELILQCEPQYPTIANWLTNKVGPGLVVGQRTAFLGYYDGAPVATAVFKRGARAKICHLRITDEFQDQNIGEVFFALMAMEAKHIASQLHFTLPEGLWEREKRFFQAFGFASYGRASKQYRTGEDELFCSAPMAQVWQATLAKMPKLAAAYTLHGQDLDSGLLLSLKPRWATSILSGKKTVEVRRKFSTKWTNHLVSLYSTRPEARIVGKARISAVVPGSPNEIWNSFGDEIDCTRQQFDSYVGKCSDVYAIVFADVQAYEN